MTHPKRVGGRVVTFICLIETRTSEVPYMEVLPAATLDAARDQARRLLREHGSPIAAHIFRDDERLDTILFEDGPAAPGLLRHGAPRSSRERPRRPR
ncbi:MAG: hypothetical protein ACXW3O_07415 [Brevundimonas sp.]